MPPPPPDDPPEREPSEKGPPQAIPAAAVSRLSLYLRELRHLRREHVAKISSSQLGRRLGVSAAVVRRDLACLGQLGRRGIGYDVDALSQQIRSALGADQTWNVALIGAGSLGTALLRYRGFSEQAFRLVAAFDTNPERIGQSISGIPILELSALEATIAQREIQLAILAVPAEAAQPIADRLAQSGVAGILNFAPVTLRIGGKTCVVDVDLASELQQLSFAILRCTRSPAPPAEIPSPPAEQPPAASEQERPASEQNLDGAKKIANPP